MTFSLPLVLALLIVAWLTGAGMSVRSVSRIWLRHWAERRLRGSTAALIYLERPHRLLTAANAGVTLALVVAGMLIGGGTRGLGTLWGALVFAGLTVLLGQLAPRAIARRWPAAVAPLVFPLLRLTDLVVQPLLVVGQTIAKVFVKTAARDEQSVERDPIQDLLREGELEGVGERQEIEIISGVVEFSEKLVGEVMTPRADIFALPEGVDRHTLAKDIAQSRYSRVPIYNGSIDTIVGMVHAFDVIKAGGDIPETLRPVAFSTPKAPCNELLFRMLRERLHIAIVRDEAGKTLGLVTLEDLLEELVGDIRDEHDEPDAPQPVQPIRPAPAR